MQDKMWLKRVLIPFWVVEMIWLIVVAILAGLETTILSEYEEESSDGGYNTVIVQETNILAIVLLAITVLSLILDITAIILFARHKLSPVTYLVFQCIKTVIWTFIFVVDIISAAEGNENAFSFLWTTVLFATSIGQLAYGSTIMHRKRTGFYERGAYRGVENADGAATHLNTGYESPPRGSYAAYNPNGAPPNPFRDPSPAPSTAAAQNPAATHPAFRPSDVGGEASAYYDPPAKYDSNHGAPQSYEMQERAYHQGS